MPSSGVPPTTAVVIAARHGAVERRGRGEVADAGDDDAGGAVELGRRSAA